MVVRTVELMVLRRLVVLLGLSPSPKAGSLSLGPGAARSIMQPTRGWVAHFGPPSDLLANFAQMDSRSSFSWS